MKERCQCSCVRAGAGAGKQPAHTRPHPSSVHPFVAGRRERLRAPRPTGQDAATGVPHCVQEHASHKHHSRPLAAMQHDLARALRFGAQQALRDDQGLLAELYSLQLDACVQAELGSGVSGAALGAVACECAQLAGRAAAATEVTNERCAPPPLATSRQNMATALRGRPATPPSGPHSSHQGGKPAGGRGRGWVAARRQLPHAGARARGGEDQGHNPPRRGARWQRERMQSSPPARPRALHASRMAHSAPHACAGANARAGAAFGRVVAGAPGPGAAAAAAGGAGAHGSCGRMHARA